MPTPNVRSKRGETLDGLKERLAWLHRQVRSTEVAIERVARTARGERAKPGELPGIPRRPPRAKSVHEENYDEFQASRCERLRQLGALAVEDQANEVAFINARMATIRAACRDDDELFALFGRFLASDSPANYTPPFPFRAFASDKWWRALLKELREERGAA